MIKLRPGTTIVRKPCPSPMPVTEARAELMALVMAEVAGIVQDGRKWLVRIELLKGQEPSTAGTWGSAELTVDVGLTDPEEAEVGDAVFGLPEKKNYRAPSGALLHWRGTHHVRVE